MRDGLTLRDRPNTRLPPARVPPSIHILLPRHSSSSSIFPAPCLLFSDAHPCRCSTGRQHDEGVVSCSHACLCCERAGSVLSRYTTASPECACAFWSNDALSSAPSLRTRPNKLSVLTPRPLPLPRLVNMLTASTWHDICPRARVECSRVMLSCDLGLGRVSLGIHPVLASHSQTHYRPVQSLCAPARCTTRRNVPACDSP